jgi:hypothetical protein
MADARPMYSLYSEELARQATISLIVGTAEDTYGVERLTDDNPAHLFKATGTSVAIEFAFADKTPIALLGLIHTTLETTDQVVWAGDDAGAWGSPTWAATITPAGWVGQGTGRWPINTWADLTSKPGYDAAGFSKYLLACGTTIGLAQPLQIGQIRLEPTIRRWSLARAPVEQRLRPLVENVTPYGVSTLYARGTTRWRFSFGLGGLFDDERAAASAQWEDVEGRGRPWLWIPNGREPACYLVRWATPQLEFERVISQTATVSGVARFNALAVEEVARGLRPGV